jgi:membrane protease YdiL (CAAX protease family)
MPLLPMIRKLLSKLPNWLEITVVITLCFGLATVTSIIQLVSGNAFKIVHLDSIDVAAILIFEFILAAITLGFLYLRGYKLWTRVRFATSLQGVAQGLGAGLTAYFAYFGLWIFVTLSLRLFGTSVPVATYSISSSPVLLIAVSLINPMFEEGFLLGYLLDRIQPASVWFFVILTTAIRVSYHLYQGWVGVIGLIPMGIVMALVYWRTRNLMPVYFAHALMDLVGLFVSA